ncbi:hypothetical protein TBK1r_62450 [Stieleria magnilauensis]|uniref:Uncharacterized protein n=1 Tax=Stieleria magnilauensis TaxID=2527963 RepID=A0ABX5Y104_9BACT|nr:hypothetical protein TBK1r_62450 [Planctomycetes bacterium TBK1r]
MVNDPLVTSTRFIMQNLVDHYASAKHRNFNFSVINFYAVAVCPRPQLLSDAKDHKFSDPCVILQIARGRKTDRSGR